MGRTPKLRIDYVPEGGHRAEDAINAAILLFGLLQIPLLNRHALPDAEEAGD